MQTGQTQDVEGLKLRIGLLAGWLIKMTPPCDQIVKLVSEEMDHPLPLGTKIKVRLHCLICKWCERYKLQLILIRSAMRQNPDKLMGQEPSAGLSAEARERLKQALRQRQSK
jgi:hypothetical protein